MNDRFLFNAVVSSYYDIDTPEHYEEFEPQIYLENVDLFSDEIGIDYDRLLGAVQRQLKLEKPEISQVMQHFEDNSNSINEEYVTIKPDKVLQCTGLKDKNGKLIYEGDIIKFEKIYECACFTDIKVVLFKIVWSECSFFAKQIKIIQGNVSYEFPLRLSELFEKELYAEHQTTINLEVIGNKFENPELLEECE